MSKQEVLQKIEKLRTELFNLATDPKQAILTMGIGTGGYGMNKKADYVICSIPDHVNVTCPYCEWEDDYDWDEIYSKMGSGLYYGNCGSVECEYCKQEIQLGECEYD